MIQFRHPILQVFLVSANTILQFDSDQYNFHTERSHLLKYLGRLGSLIAKNDLVLLEATTRLQSQLGKQKDRQVLWVLPLHYKSVCNRESISCKLDAILCAFGFCKLVLLRVGVLPTAHIEAAVILN